MLSSLTRRQWLGSAGAIIPAMLARPRVAIADEAKDVSVTIAEGDLKAVFRDNSKSPGLLSGLDSLFHLHESPDFDAFDPDSKGASAGLNFEHIISGHEDSRNAFTPRHGLFAIETLPGGKSVKLIRRREDDPWSMSSTVQYTVSKPHYIDMDFRCIPHDKSAFGKRGYAILFFANYMNNVEQVALNFRGVNGPDQSEQWIAADAPREHPDWNQGGTYRSQSAADLQYDVDQKFRLNNWSYDYPRFTRPFYFGKAANGMVLMMMFDKSYTEEDEIRFSVFKFKLARFPRPAWDFQYVLRNLQQDQEYGFRARLVWKKFVSEEDCLGEYEAWSQ